MLHAVSHQGNANQSHDWEAGAGAQRYSTCLACVKSRVQSPVLEGKKKRSYHITLTKMAKLKKWNKRCGGYGESETLTHCWRDCKTCAAV
jgi:hypothetical protein